MLESMIHLQPLCISLAADWAAIAFSWSCGHREVKSGVAKGVSTKVAPPCILVFFVVCQCDCAARGV